MDFYQDAVGGTLKKIAGVLPDLVKQASFEAPDKLPDEAFAWPEKRAFPIHRAEDILLSTAYYVKGVINDGQKFPAYVKQNLVKAAYIWKIENEFTDIYKATAELLAKQASRGTVWALDEEYKGQRIQKYPLMDNQHVKMACDFFTKNYTKYPLTWRVKIAERINRRANELDVEVPHGSVVKTYTRKAMIDLDKAAAFIAVRMPYLDKKGMNKEALALGKVAKMLTQDYSDSVDGERLVNILLKIDKKANLDYVYDKEIPDPFMSIYNELEKTASEVTAEGVMNFAGTFYKMSELAQLPLSTYENALGSEFASEISNGTKIDMDKLASILPTLPQDEKATLSLHIKKAMSDAPKKGKAFVEPHVAR